MLELEPNKPSFKEILLENSSTSPRVDVLMPLNEEEEVTLLDDDVSISMDGPYPQVCFSERVHSLIDEHNKGKFARVAVVVDISKPLCAIHRFYEGLPSICYTYGKVGHIKENYSQGPKEQAVIKPITVMEEIAVQTPRSKVGESDLNTKDQDFYGPWM
ncbi:hypothetical protein CXB51_010189 [Gossypium anomalum]|uniref:Uncharacterized protein n=1 Tax=Gossypium anomalum TaxID=47600 RepID=A0A8J6D2T1_9ROSI|nr:hypothetical protein CXB51_010189 [Gossypium anomalum]